MKRILVLLVLGLGISISAFAGTGYDAYCAVVRELEEFTNTCGPGSVEGTWAGEALNYLSGNVGACDQHDYDYYTLGMPKELADNRLFMALRIDELDAFHPVAWIFWGAVSVFGDSSYRSAQSESREEFRRIHHGHEWESYGYGVWGPWMGHVPINFPECDESCF